MLGLSRPRRAVARSVVVALALMAAGASAVRAQDTVSDLQIEGGKTERVLYVGPAHPHAALVMLPGGDGDVGIEPGGTIDTPNNFLVRTRALWVAHDFGVFILDAPGGEDLRGLRSGARYGAAVDAAAGFAAKQTGAPVFLVGTSQGSIAAMNGAARAPAGLIAGLVLTESVSRRSASGETVFDAAPENVRVPALVVVNPDDVCPASPPADGPRIVAAMRASPDARLQAVAGGTKRSKSDCDALTPHGYYGVESAAVDTIAAWLDAHLRN
jgi:pimeloyl-ACP methyl ester carboxylesterase